MNAQVQPIQQARAAAPMEVTIKGRVEVSRAHNGIRYTQVMTPAADAYSRPQIVEVRSKRQIGMKGEEVTVLARLGGYTRKAFPMVDKETGERTMVVPVDMTLDAVE